LTEFEKSSSLDLTERFQGKVLNIWEVPDREQAAGHREEHGTFIIQIAFPWENFSGSGWGVGSGVGPS
jgi:ribulose 1,5-bisphosphate carboxylase large subunit-like protein